MLKKWFEKDDYNLIQNHGALSNKELSLLLDRTVGSIESRVRVLGIAKQKLWSAEEDIFLKQNYFKDKSFIIKELGRSWRGIAHRAEKLNIKRPKSSNYSNIDFFDNWSNNMAYVLGFIAAGGCICKNNLGNKCLTIALSIKDIEYLKKIGKLLAPNKKIHTSFQKASNGKFYESCRLAIGSDYMCNKIISIGIGYNKSSNLKFPNIPKEHISHFIRGYFDGDGSIYKRKGFNVWILDFVGSESFLTQISEIISYRFDINKRTLYKKSNTNKVKYIRYTTSQAQIILNWLYRDANIYMKRKYLEYKRMLERPIQHNKNYTRAI